MSRLRVSCDWEGAGQHDAAGQGNPKEDRLAHW